MSGTTLNLAGTANTQNTNASVQLFAPTVTGTTGRFAGQLSAQSGLFSTSVQATTVTGTTGQFSGNLSAQTISAPGGSAQGNGVLFNNGGVISSNASGFSFVTGTNTLTVGSTINTTTVTGTTGQFGGTVSAQNGTFANATAYSCHFLSSFSQTAVTSVVMAIPSGFPTYQIRIARIHPAVDGAQVMLDVSVNGGATYLAGTNYIFGMFGTSASTATASGVSSATGTTEFRLTPASFTGLSTGHFSSAVIDIKQISNRFQIGWDIGYFESGTGDYNAIRGDGLLHGDGGTVTHIRFRMHNGNVNNFDAVLYGFRSS